MAAVSLTDKLSTFRDAVATEKGGVETQHSNRHSRYGKYTHKLGFPQITRQEQDAGNMKQHERSSLLAKSKVWTPADFEALRVIGEGSFGIVYMAREKGEKEVYALKQMKKTAYARKNHRERALAERDILAKAESRWIVDLYATFQDAENAFMVMEFLQGGDLIGHLLKRKRFSHKETCFYMAELLVALETVHACGFVHRDVKPDNVVLTTKGHIKLLDFGLCHQDLVEPLPEEDRKVSREGARRIQLKSAVGTPQYMAPEVYRAGGYGPEADLWSLGIVTYECLVGVVPFHGGQAQGLEAIKLIKQKVMEHERVLQEQLAKVRAQRGYINDVAERFLTRVICARPHRLNADQCRCHAFFSGLDFNRLHELQPPIVPSVSASDDTSHFDQFDFRPLPASRRGAKDASMEWVGYDFDRKTKELHGTNANPDRFPAQGNFTNLRHSDSEVFYSL